MLIKIKAFLKGFDYAVKNHDKIEDHYFQSLPGAAWRDPDTQHLYRKSIQIGRKYAQYRYEIIALCCIFMGILLLVTL
jgi:hypothetical protein